MVSFEAQLGANRADLETRLAQFENDYNTRVNNLAANQATASATTADQNRVIMAVEQRAVAAAANADGRVQAIEQHVAAMVANAVGANNNGQHAVAKPLVPLKLLLPGVYNGDAAAWRA